MKNHFIFYFLLILIFTFSSCSKEKALPLSTEERIQQALQTLETQQEIDFFDLDFVTRKHPQLLPSVRTRDDRSDWIDSVYQHILFEHQELSIVPAMIQQFGYPVWNESDLLEDEEGLGIPAVLIPFIRLDQNHISAYLLSVPTGSGDWHFIMVDRPTLDAFLVDPDSGNHPDLRFHIAAYTRFDALLFGTKNQTYMDWLVEKGDLAYGEEWDVVSPRSYSYEYKYCVEWLVPFTSGDTRDGDGCKRWVYITVNVCTPINNNPSNSSDPSFGSGPIGGIINAGGIPHNNNGNGGTTPVDDPLSDPTSLMDLCSQFDAATGFEGTPQDLEALNQLGVSLDYLANNCAAVQVIFTSNLFSNAEIAAMLQADNGEHRGLLVQIANRVINNGDPAMINLYVDLIDQTDLAFKGFEMLWMRISNLRAIQNVSISNAEEMSLLLDPQSVAAIEDIFDAPDLQDANGQLFPQANQAANMAVDLVNQNLLSSINDLGNGAYLSILHQYYPEEEIGLPILSAQWALIISMQYAKVLEEKGLDHNSLTSYEQLYYMSVATALALNHSVVALKELPLQINNYLSAQLEELPQTAEEWEALAYVVKDLVIEIGPEFLPIVGEFLAFKNSLSALSDGNYTDAGFEIAVTLMGIIPITKVSQSVVKAFNTVRKGFKALKVIRNIAQFYKSSFAKLKMLFDNGWSSRWVDNGVNLLDEGGEHSARLSTRTEHVVDEIDDFDAEVDLATIDVRRTNGWTLISPEDINNATRITPSGANNTYIGKGAIAQNAQRLRVSEPGEMHDLIGQIQNGDPTGSLTEQLSHHLYTEVYSNSTVYSNVHFNSSGHGFDNVVVHPDGSVIINEAKQLSNGAATLRGPNTNISPPLPSQMTGAWVNYVLLEMSQITSLQSLSNTIQFALENNQLSKIVTVVDKSTGEIIITALDDF